VYVRGAICFPIPSFRTRSKDKRPVSFFSNFVSFSSVSCPSWFSFFSQIFTVSYIYPNFSLFLYIFHNLFPFPIFLLLPLIFFTLRFCLFFASFIVLKIYFLRLFFLFSTLVFFGFVLTKFPPF
jgi:hypothetical protein